MACPQWLGLLEAVGSYRACCGILLCTGGHGILICSLLSSLTCIGKFRCTSRKHHTITSNIARSWGLLCALTLSPAHYQVPVGHFVVLGLLMYIVVSWWVLWVWFPAAWGSPIVLDVIFILMAIVIKVLASFCMFYF